MSTLRKVSRVALGAAIATAVAAGPALAGGFAVREQSAMYQGTSFAGSAAGGDLSSLFWNAAAAATVSGIETSSNFSLILGDAELQATGQTGLGAINAANSNSGNIAQGAIVPASYAAMEISAVPGLAIAIGINAPFGLTTKPQNDIFVGNRIGYTSNVFTTNANPTIAYQLTPALAVGVGLQIQYIDAKFAFQTAAGGQSANFRGDDIGFGFTAGALWTPTSSTKIGIGWRSRIEHELDGTYTVPVAGVGGTVAATADMTLPDIVTLSIQQSLSPSTRLMGTVEWSNWTTFDKVPINGAPSAAFRAELDANWGNGWFFALGGEYDYSPALTLRAGLAYELTPIGSPEERLTGVPDTNRIWASVGATYDLSQTMSLDLGYSHIFGQEEQINRNGAAVATQGLNLQATVDPSVDIFSVGLKMKFGGHASLK